MAPRLSQVLYDALRLKRLRCSGINEYHVWRNNVAADKREEHVEELKKINVSHLKLMESAAHCRHCRRWLRSPIECA